jgi:hypothetical protein
MKSAKELIKPEKKAIDMIDIGKHMDQMKKETSCLMVAN